MWWKPYLIEFLEVVVRAFVFKDFVNADRVFVTGYSAGGDGVYHLAPMMADFWAGAAMMAGHPNKVEL
jgi:poly(3-hydroxybutyrate) depolymerase